MPNVYSKVKKGDRKLLIAIVIGAILESICIIESVNWIFQMHWW